MGNAHTSTRVQLSRNTRHAEWCALYVAGMTQQEIADRYGVSRSAVRDAVKKALTEARQRRADIGDLILDLQIRRYEDLYGRCIEALDDAHAGREVGRAQLISAARGILDSLSKIQGLDQAATATVLTESQLDRDLRVLTETMQQALPPAPNA